MEHPLQYEDLVRLAEDLEKIEKYDQLSCSTSTSSLRLNAKRNLSFDNSHVNYETDLEDLPENDGGSKKLEIYEKHLEILEACDDIKDLVKDALRLKYECLSPKSIYLLMCRFLEVSPIKSFIENMQSNLMLDLRHHGLGGRGTRAICRTLWENGECETLLLSDNVFGSVGTESLRLLLSKNHIINCLEIDQNEIGSDGVEILVKIFEENCQLVSINLSSNNFKENDMELLLKSLMYLKSLKYLNLSHNSFGVNGSVALSQFIANNDTVEIMDISWAEIMNDGAQQVAISIRENIRLRHLNLTHNSFAKKNGVDLIESLIKNESLISIDLSNIFLNVDAANRLGNLIKLNETIRIIIIDGNPIPTSSIELSLKEIHTKNNVQIQEFSMKGIPVCKEVVEIIKTITEQYDMNKNKNMEEDDWRKKEQLPDWFWRRFNTENQFQCVYDHILLSNNNDSLFFETTT
ncbi:hypothetical protein SNEBB_003007 [Seison nebaliae]|nr:hypothetical protein SNEBB_003007 [Seison nebaliae]